MNVMLVPMHVSLQAVQTLQVVTRARAMPGFSSKRAQRTSVKV